MAQGEDVSWYDSIKVTTSMMVVALAAFNIIIYFYKKTNPFRFPGLQDRALIALVIFGIMWVGFLIDPLIRSYYARAISRGYLQAKRETRAKREHGQRGQAKTKSTKADPPFRRRRRQP